MVADFAISALAIIALSYLLGSIPTAYLVARVRGVNIFEVGSGNMGATNVIRALGLSWGLVVWLLDSLKGILAILAAAVFMPGHPALATVIAATAAVVGHNWSVFAALVTGSLRGGKGAATWFGTMLVIAPLQVVVAMTVLGGLIIAATRYVSLAVLGMFSLSGLWMLVLISQSKLPNEYSIYTLLVTAMMLYRFRENIQRLLAGTERRLGERA